MVPSINIISAMAASTAACRSPRSAARGVNRSIPRAISSPARRVHGFASIETCTRG